jgi:hypothetical protein
MKIIFSKKSIFYSFAAIAVMMFSNSCTNFANDPMENALQTRKQSDSLAMANASTKFKAAALYGDEHGINNCEFSSATDVLPGNKFDYVLTLGQPSVGRATHSWYEVEASWFKGYINKPYANTVDDNPYRGRAEVMASQMIRNPEGKTVYIKMTYFLPKVCSFNTSKINEIGAICQLITCGGTGDRWMPLFLYTGQGKMSVYNSLTTSVDTEYITKLDSQGKVVDPRGTMHTIEFWVVLSKDPAKGYYYSRYDNLKPETVRPGYDCTDRKLIYHGRTLPDNMNANIAWKCGTYSMQERIYYSEVWIHNAYLSW